MQHYVIAGHGYVMVGYDSANYEPTGVAPVAIPDKIQVVVYIPPGSEFSQATGIQLQSRLLFGGGLGTQGELDTFLADIRAKLTRKRDIQKKNTFFGYTKDAFAGHFPALYGKASADHDLYDYTVQGPASANDTHGFLWGIYKRGSSGGVVCMADFHGGDKLKMSVMLQRIATDAGTAGAVVHCIFCRVEVLDKDAKANLDPSVQSQEIGLYGFDL